LRIQPFKVSGGPGIFVRSLCEYMEKHYSDVKIVKKNPDIYFSSVWRGKPPPGARVVHRIDGVYFNKLQKGIDSMNKDLRKAIMAANSCVYQSKYSWKMAKGILGVKKKKLQTIIRNGIDFSVYDDIPVDKMGFDKVFVACAAWRPLKRPQSIAKGFKEAKVPNSVLIMIGSIDKQDKVKGGNIHYVNKIDRSKIFAYYKSADALIHISRVDACSNVIVEALAAGTPVITNNVGGSPELVREDGVILEIDPPLKYKKFKMRKPDRVDPKIIAEGIHECLGRKWEIDRQDLHMKNCAQQYYDFFNRVLAC